MLLFSVKQSSPARNEVCSVKLTSEQKSGGAVIGEDGVGTISVCDT
jgi:hypothetical protein